MLRFTFTIFPSLHPNFGVSWENMGLEPPPPLLCKKTMTTDQQTIKTNIYFSHFSDNFFTFSHTQIQILARHGKKWAWTNVVSLFSHRVKHLILSFHSDFSTTWCITWFFTWYKIPIEMKPSPNQTRQSRQVLIQKWSKLLVRKIIKNFIEKNDKIRWLYLFCHPW